MKKLLNLSAISLVLVTAGCSNNDEMENPIEYPISDKGIVEIKYENQRLLLQNAIFITERGDTPRNTLSFIAENCDKKISLSLTVPLTEGTHTFGDGSTYGSFYLYDKMDCVEIFSDYLFESNRTLKDRFIASIGSINIEEITSETVKGTFGFRAYTFDNGYRVVFIEDGKFDLKI
ncbi:DUF6252 family protein [Hyunsoonleella jejuensis]|nr:DUF6252 family protein [Hyunsoonleella jejuensis]